MSDFPAGWFFHIPHAAHYYLTGHVHPVCPLVGERGTPYVVARDLGLVDLCDACKVAVRNAAMRTK